MTSARAPTRSASTWATCAARPRTGASRGCCTPCAASATRCAGRHEFPPPHRDRLGRLSPRPDQVRGYQQVVGAGGTIIGRSAPGVSLPVDAATRRLAEHGGQPLLSDARVGGIHLRILAEPLGDGRAVQFAQPLTETDSLLSRLRVILTLIDAGGIALAALLGRLVAGAAVQPLKRLTRAAEHVALTRDLSGRIAPAGEDELGRLAKSFNAMLD